MASSRNNKGSGFKHFRKENRRFGQNKGRTSNLVIDEHIQEATPENMRIEIDNIIKEYVDSEEIEYKFPPDLNNLQRKYIHYKAAKMNLTSKSYGKEPNRRLHLKKLPKQVANQSFNISPSWDISQELDRFEKVYDHLGGNQHFNVGSRGCGRKHYHSVETDPVIPNLVIVEPSISIWRKGLPIYEQREKILDVINKNQVIIISSETGSGKTTQIPQYIMEECAAQNKPCKVICTQPRRISTLGAAERVAQERGEQVGASVGYHIRLESKFGSQTSLFYCTVGVFLRKLMSEKRNLKHITHVIVDEIHERDKLSDFLLICLKQCLASELHIKVILMSATVDTQKFQNYFNTNAVLSIPGRLHPITNYYLEDVLAMTGFFSPQMRTAMAKLESKTSTASNPGTSQMTMLSEEDQHHFDYTLEGYLNYCESYDYKIHYEEATADLLQLFITEDVPVDQQHSTKGLTALMVACHLGDIEFVDKLCTMGAKLDICDVLGKTAYTFAELSGHQNILLMLEYAEQENLHGNKESNNIGDSQYLRQLYDMTTPDDFMDFDLIVTVIKFIHANCTKGAVLVFLPGYDEIMQCSDAIVDSTLDPQSYRIFILHSSMNMKDQCDVFKHLPIQRKIILSTNIAETSITIEDVVFVIDLGRAKEKVYDSYNKLSALQTQWISKAGAKQREGRAGRVQPGHCFKLYSHQRYKHMAFERIPEILRVSLEELCLNAKIIADDSMNIYEFLSLAPDPPTSNSVNAAIENLQSLGALDKEEDLTRLGEYLAQLTVEPRLGKMLIYSCIFRCVQPILTLTATLAHKDPFQLPPQASLKTAAAAKRRELIGPVPSDHYVFLKVFEKWQDEKRTGYVKSFCRDNFISESTMRQVMQTRSQFLGQLRALGFLTGISLEQLNEHGNSWGLVKAIMSVAFFPNIAFLSPKSQVLSTRTEKKVFIHNTSVCASKKVHPWCFYDELVKNKVNFMIRGVTLITSLPVALLCGVESFYPSPNEINIDTWLHFTFPNTALVNFRKAIQNIVERSLIDPWHLYGQTNKLVSDTLRKVMDLEEFASDLPQPSAFGSKSNGDVYVHPNARRDMTNQHQRRFYNGDVQRGGYNWNSPGSRANNQQHYRDNVSASAVLLRGLQVSGDTLSSSSANGNYQSGPSAKNKHRGHKQERKFKK